MHALAAIRRRIQGWLCCFIAAGLLLMGWLIYLWMTRPAQFAYQDALLLCLVGGIR